MPFRSKHTLEHWLDEFTASRGAGHNMTVVIQDGSDGSDTGLVVVKLHNATTSVFMEPAELGGMRWRTTIEPQPDPTILTSHQLSALAAELQVAAELCAFLEAKSLGHMEPSPGP